ncbi:hypothetical protein C8F04DRAFT_1391335 [Mycena alexandri]|uniref:Uncharacterized protein n=1 Tax=Mycena alexandri TaxID=1745969 RepID=A0AAD6T835_9AGAR|nr:hypothetical protein C8F04DRAFT_1391335 [Mycena alexandri]
MMSSHTSFVAVDKSSSSPIPSDSKSVSARQLRKSVSASKRRCRKRPRRERQSDLPADPHTALQTIPPAPPLVVHILETLARHQPFDGRFAQGVLATIQLNLAAYDAAALGFSDEVFATIVATAFLCALLSRVRCRKFQVRWGARAQAVGYLVRALAF